MTMLGAHVTTGSRNGYGGFATAKPRLVVAVNEGGALLEAKEKSGGHTVTVFRDTTVYLEAPLDFNTYSGSMADLAAYWYPQVKAKWQQNEADYYTITNEIGGNDLASLNRLIAYERAFMRLANADGYKVCVLNCAGGSPGDFQLWKMLHAPFILEAWEAGNIYGRHAYGGDLVDAQGRVLIGNPSRPLEEADYLLSLGGLGGIALTEVGLDGGFGYAGEPRFSTQMIGYEQALRSRSATIIGMACWNLGSWQASNANWQNSMPMMTAYMQANPSPPWAGGVTPPPASQNLLKNPSYEGGWYHIGGIPELQIANDWEFQWKEGSVTTQDGFVFNALRPECRVLPKSQLPPAEQALFVLDGYQTVKVFKGSGAVEFKYLELAQADRPAGKYELVVNVYADLVMAYQNGQKVFADDPLAGEYRWVINTVVGEWKSLYPYGSWDSLLHVFDWPGGPMRVGIQLRSRFALNNSGFFLDAHSLEQIGDSMGEVTPPTKLKHTIVLMPQDTTLAEQDAIAHELYPQRTGFAYSADLAHSVMYAGTPESKVIIYGPERWQNSITEWMDERNINYETRAMPEIGTGGGEQDVEFTHWPTANRQVNQYFGNDPDYYEQFGFPGHEGVDLSSPFNTPYMAVADGVVIKVTDKRADGLPSAYGWHCVISHKNGLFTTLYAHAREDLEDYVQVGQAVEGGEVIGYSGNTGKSSGPHLHFTLKIRDYTHPGWSCCPGYADPWPYLNPVYHDIEPPIPPLQEGWVFGQYAPFVKSDLRQAMYGLNLRHEPNVAGYRYGMVKQGSSLTDTGVQATNGYVRVAAAIADIADYTPIKQSDVWIGLHAGADSNFLPGEEGAWIAMKPTIAKVLASHNPADLEWVKAHFPGLPIIVRPFLDWGDRYISPAQFINDTMPDTKRTMGILNDGRQIYLELPGNEPNLEAEGWLHSWQNGGEYAQWGLPVVAAFRQQFPGTPVYFPGLSPGGTVPGVRQNSWDFIAQARQLIEESCDGICIHVYIDPPGGYTVSRALDEVRRYRDLYPFDPILVSEFSWNKNDGTAPEKATSYLEFWNGLKSIPLVRGVVWFVASASNPAWSWHSGSAEVLVENGQSVGIAEIIGQR